MIHSKNAKVNQFCIAKYLNKHLDRSKNKYLHYNGAKRRLHKHHFHQNGNSRFPCER